MKIKLYLLILILFQFWVTNGQTPNIDIGTSEVSVGIYNAMGQQLFTQNISQTTRNIVLNLTGIPDGGYFVVLYLEGKYYYKKIILSH